MTRTKTLCLALLLSATPAFPATLVYSGTFSNNPGAYPTVFNSSVPRFDPSFGTLLSVAFTLTADSSANVEYENEAASGGSATANLIGLVLGSFSSLSNTVGLTDSDATIITLDDEPGIPDFAGGDYHNYGPLVDIDGDSETETTGLAPFIGPGTINLSVTDNQSWSVSGVGDGVTRITQSRSAVDWMVVYTFIPEPSAALCTLLGFSAIGLRRRR